MYNEQVLSWRYESGRGMQKVSWWSYSRNLGAESNRNRLDLRENEVIVATEAFGCDIDSNYARTVVVAGGSRSLMRFWQQAEWYGRDRNRAEVRVFYHPALEKERGEMDDWTRRIYSRLGNFREWVENTTVSRRNAL